MLAHAPSLSLPTSEDNYYQARTFNMNSLRESQFCNQWGEKFDWNFILKNETK